MGLVNRDYNGNGNGIAYMNVLIQVLSIPNVVLLLENLCTEIDHLI